MSWFKNFVKKFIDEVIFKEDDSEHEYQYKKSYYYEGDQEDQEVEPEPDTRSYPSDIPLHFNAPPGEYYEKSERLTRDGNKK